MVSCKNSSFYKFFPSQIKFCGGVLNSYNQKKKPRSKILAFFIKADNYAVVSIMVPLFASIAVGAFGAGAFAFTD